MDDDKQRPRRRQGEGTVYYDEGRGRWVGQAWIDNRRRKVTAASERDAVEQLGRLIHGNEAERRAERNLTVSRLLEDWYAKALPGRNLSSRTMDQHRWAIDKLTPELGKAKINKLDVAAVERALARIAAGSQGAPLARWSIIKVRGALSQAFRWAQSRQVVVFNPAAVAELPRDLVAPQPRRALSTDELERLFVALRGHDLEWLYRSCGQLGLRPGESSGLCADALDFDAGTLAVIRAVQRQAHRPVLTDSLKTKSSRRTLEMPASLAQGLRTLVEAKGLTGTTPLWTDSNGGPVWYSTVRKELAAVCDAADIDPAVRPNELRHTCATILANDHGVAPHVLADLLGHTSTAMVEAYYRHRPAIIRTVSGLDF